MVVLFYCKKPVDKIHQMVIIIVTDYCTSYFIQSKRDDYKRPARLLLVVFFILFFLKTINSC